MITPGYSASTRSTGTSPGAKPDRLLVGVLAGAALVLLAGKVLGLGQRTAAGKDQRPS